MLIPIFNRVNSHGFSQAQVEKLGNTIIYLANKLPNLSKTKILKLLFIIEESAIKKFGFPFFGVDFQLWKHGPVIKDVFIDLSDEPEILKDYIERDTTDNANFRAKKVFCDDEFSVNDLNLLDTIVSFARDKNASTLVKFTHGQNSLWRKSAIKYGILEMLEQELVNSTNFEVDFELLFEKDSLLLQRYEEAKENLEFSRQLKGI